MTNHDKVVEAIKEFNWGNYGLDHMEDLPADDWAHALADEVIAAIVKPEQ